MESKQKIIYIPDYSKSGSHRRKFVKFIRQFGYDFELNIDGTAVVNGEKCSTIATAINKLNTPFGLHVFMHEEYITYIKKLSHIVTGNKTDSTHWVGRQKTERQRKSF